MHFFHGRCRNRILTNTPPIKKQMDLGIERRKNAAELPRIQSFNISLYQCFGERTNKMPRRKDNNTFQSKWCQWSVAPWDGHICQSAQAWRSSSGFQSRITRCSKSYMETCCIRLDGTLNLFLQKFKPMRRDRETCCKNTSNDLKHCQ